MKKKQSKWLGVFGALLLCLIYFVLGTIYEVASAKSIYKCEMSVVTTNDGNFYMVKNGKFQSAILRFGADGTINGTYIEDNTNFLSSEKMSFASVMTTVDNNVYFLREYINSETNCRVRYDVLKLYEEDGKLKATNLYTKVGENLPQIWSINIENDQLFLASVYSDNRTVQIDQFDIIDKGEALFLRASQKYINSDDEPIIKALYLKGNAIMIGSSNRVHVANNVNSDKIIFPKNEEQSNLITFSTVNGPNLIFSNALESKIYTYNILSDTLTSQELADFIYSDKYSGDSMLYVNIGSNKRSVAVATETTYDKLEVIFWSNNVLQKITELKLPTGTAILDCTGLVFKAYVLTLAVVLVFWLLRSVINRRKQIVFRFIRIIVIFVGCSLFILGIIEYKTLYSQSYENRLKFAYELNKNVLANLSVADVENLNATFSYNNESYENILRNSILNNMHKDMTKDWDGLCYYNHLMLVNNNKELIMGPSEYDEYLMPIENIYSSEDCDLFYKALNNNEIKTGTIENYCGTWITCVFPVVNSSGETVGLLTTLLDIGSLNFETAFAIGKYAVIASVSLIVLIILIYYFFKKVLQPLTDLKVSFKEVAVGNYAVRLVGMANDEFADINSTFNKMCEEISNYVYNLKVVKSNYNKFVPESVYRIFDETNIGKINVGDFVEDDYTFVLQNIGQFKFNGSELLQKEIVDFTSQLFRIVNRCVNKNGGVMISSSLGMELLQAIFEKDSSKAIDYALNVLGDIEIGFENLKQLDSISLIHKSKTVFGISGDEDNAFPIVNSEGANDLMRHLFKLRDAGVRVIATDAVFEDIKEKYSTRYIGFVMSSDFEKKYELFEILDACETTEKSKKISTKKAFETGLKLFYDNNFYQARAEFSRVLQENPEDRIAKWYLLICDKCYKNSNIKTSHELLGENI